MKLARRRTDRRIPTCSQFLRNVQRSSVRRLEFRSSSVEKFVSSSSARPPQSGAVYRRRNTILARISARQHLSRDHSAALGVAPVFWTVDAFFARSRFGLGPAGSDCPRSRELPGVARPLAGDAFWPQNRREGASRRPESGFRVFWRFCAIFRAVVGRTPCVT